MAPLGVSLFSLTIPTPPSGVWAFPLVAVSSSDSASLHSPRFSLACLYGGVGSLVCRVLCRVDVSLLFVSSPWVGVLVSALEWHFLGPAGAGWMDVQTCTSLVSILSSGLGQRDIKAHGLSLWKHVSIRSCHFITDVFDCCSH